ncbi:MAG: helix-hairpin-helix domain-containing protein [Oscillospiraceae bacterium]|nr:helix-hairpin-helix domain-containing protein [Oscillospiraceae bacterium]
MLDLNKTLKLLFLIAVVMVCGIIVYNVYFAPNYTTLQVFSISSDTETSFEVSEDPPDSSSSEKSSQSEPEPIVMYFNLNTVTHEELCLIDGIGSVTAGRILAYRDDLGGYTEMEQVMNIVGIGEGTFNKLKEYLYLE